MQIFGLALAAIAIYFGYNKFPIYYLLPITFAGILLYYQMRETIILGMIQRSGLFKTATFLLITQFITWLVFYGMGYMAMILFT